MTYPYATWTIESTRGVQFGLQRIDAALVGQTIWLLTPGALEALPDNQEVISINGEREMKELADDDTRAGFMAYGLLPADWHRLLGSAVDKLGALSNVEA